MSLMGRAGALIDKAKAEVSQFDEGKPHTAGRIRQTLGGVLIADGLVGLENPFDGKKSRPGILGAALGIVAGIALCIFGIHSFLTAPDPDAVAQGTVTSLTSTTDEDGDRECRIGASFEVDGQTYSSRSSGRSADNCGYSEGAGIEVHYESASPTENYVGTSPKMTATLLAIGGVLAALISFITFLIRAASIWFGWKLWRTGSAMVKANPKSENDDQLVADVKKKFTGFVTGTKTSVGSVLSGLKR